jgi:hypothetical protein
VDLNCPYCNEAQEINHDDGYGYTEGTEHSQDCVGCGKEFKFVPSFSINYKIFCSGEHELKQSSIERHSMFFSCTKCDYFEMR